jgi:alkylation response protein AidB-like acyl-CoA dehydrogenase
MYLELLFREEGWAERTVAALSAFADEHRVELASGTRDGRFPAELYQEMGKRGWVAPLTPVKHGGSGHATAEYCLIEEEVGRLALVSPQISIQGQRWLLDWGTTEQQGRYLSGIARGEIIFAESISEPGAGSSLKALRATAVPKGTDWILNGSKTHVNLGAQCHVTLVYAMAPQGLTAFLVDTDLPGISRRQTDPIGLRLIPTADLEFCDVRVPGTAVLGQVGAGLDTFLATFNTSRLGNASELIGIGRRALAQAARYAADRRVGDNVVTDFQGIQWILANAYGALYGASLARDRAANRTDGGQENAFETTIAKKLAIDAAEQAVNDAFSLTGGHGLYHDTEYAQLLQDTKVLRTAGGSLEVLRNYLARRVLRSPDLAGLAGPESVPASGTDC